MNLKKIFIPYFLVSIQLAYVTSSEQEKQQQKNDRYQVFTTGIQGNIVGEVTSEAGIFWGIPFSQPPVGNYRWKKPRPWRRFTDNFWNATYKRPGCPQDCPYKRGRKYLCVFETSEDCLYLNIWIPRRILAKRDNSTNIKRHHYVINDDIKNNRNESLAVMVYFHGGNFLHGSSSQIIYDGRFLAHRGDVIVVTANYRLGPLGYLVQGEGDDAAVGNYGAWDIIMALKWVQRNIQYFGGNPNKVTACGQSAGAEVIGILLTTSYGDGLFHQVIMESNPLSVPYRNMSSAKEFGSQFAIKAGCNPHDMKCLRNTNVSKIVKASVGVPFDLFSSESILLQAQQWSPVIDGNLLYENPISIFQRGDFRKVPMIIGGNTHDGFQYVKLIFSSKVSQFVYQLAIDAILRERANVLLDIYPPNCCDNTNEVNDIIADYVFQCPARLFSHVASKDSWFYVYNGTLPFKSVWAFEECRDRACHGAEIASVFDPSPMMPDYNEPELQYKLAHRVQYYWSNMAKHGNPNGKHGEIEEKELKQIQ
ncbi:crystal protein-like isoform X2 [Styela clava]